MAVLDLSPIMNIIILPFTLVVSVIAATTVFRHTYGGLGDNTSETNGLSTANGSGGLRFSFFGGTRTSWTTTAPNLSTRPTRDRPPMDNTKSQEIGIMSLHRVLDIAVDKYVSPTVSYIVPTKVWSSPLCYA